MRCGLFLTLVIAVISSAWATTTVPVGGAYGPTPLTPELKTLLFTSLADESLYRSNAALRLCVKDISLVESQRVAGTNYRYTAKACDIAFTLRKQSPNQLPTHAQIAKYLGQCNGEMVRNCFEVDSTIVLFKGLNKSVQVTDMSMRPTATPDPTEPITHRPQNPTTPPTVDGAYHPVPLTAELSTLLYTSLADQKLYANTVSALVCVKNIASVDSQIVGWRNYRYATTACDVVKTLQQQQQSNQQHAPYAKYLGQCQAKFATKCVEVSAQIVVFKRWDGVIQVSEITIVKPKAPGRVRTA